MQIVTLPQGDMVTHVHKSGCRNISKESGHPNGKPLAYEDCGHYEAETRTEVIKKVGGSYCVFFPCTKTLKALTKDTRPGWWKHSDHNRGGPGPKKGTAMKESTSWEHYAEESLTHDDYGTRPVPVAQAEPCQHLYVSYHGRYRAECQDCGEEIGYADPVEIEIPMFFQTELRSDGEWPK